MSINLDEYIRERVYGKDETYTQSEVINAINQLQLVTVVEELPVTDIRDNQIYLILNNEDLGEEYHNQYDLFVHVNGEWEQLDSIEFNIDEYYNKSTLDNKLSLKSDKGHGHSNATNNTDGFMSYTDKTKLDNIEDGANNVLFDTTPVKNSVKAVTSGGLYTALDGKAVKNHASTNTTYGVSTTTKYGHSKASETVPLMNSGQGSIGEAVDTFARADHIHPTDTTRASTSSATSSSAGLMSASDKTKLDSINISNYYTSGEVDSLINNLVLDEIDIIIDNELSNESNNPVTNSAIKTYVDSAVSNITITNSDLINKINNIILSMGDMGMPSTILLSSNKNILSVSENDSATFSANVLDDYNNVVVDQLIYFYETYTPSLRFNITPKSIISTNDSVSLVTTVTDGDDGNRVALNNQTIQYYAWNDELFKVGGTTSDNDTDTFLYNTTYVTETKGVTGTTIENVGSTFRNYSANISGTSTNEMGFIGDTITEFDVVNVNRYAYFVLRNNDGEFYRTILSTGHYRVEYTDNVVHLFKDGTEVGEGTETNNEQYYSIRFGLNGNSSMTYKDFIIGGY